MCLRTIDILFKKVFEILNPACDIALKLQRKYLLLSDIFFNGYACKIKVEKELRWLSHKFLNTLIKQAEYLLSNWSVLAAVYLHPMYQTLLSYSKKDLQKNI